MYLSKEKDDKILGTQGFSSHGLMLWLKNKLDWSMKLDCRRWVVCVNSKIIKIKKPKYIISIKDQVTICVLLWQLCVFLFYSDYFTLTIKTSFQSNFSIFQSSLKTSICCTNDLTAKTELGPERRYWGKKGFSIPLLAPNLIVRTGIIHKIK